MYTVLFWKACFAGGHTHNFLLSGLAKTRSDKKFKGFQVLIAHSVSQEIAVVSNFGEFNKALEKLNELLASSQGNNRSTA